MTAGRKVVFVLGAGASFGAGAYAKVQGGGRLPIPTQATFWGTFLRFCKSTKNRKTIEAFLFRYFLGYAKVPGKLSASERRNMLAPIDVEEVFTFLSERVRAPASSPQLQTYAGIVWKALIEEIGQTFRRFGPNKATRHNYRRMVKNLIRARDVVVSFNYDTVFERSLPGKYKWHYTGVASPANGSLRVLKPHGSVNWHAAGSTIKVKPSPRGPVLVAPTHLKFVETASHANGASAAGYLDQSPAIKDVWREMEVHMKEARALVFIGYSFPVADLYFSSVLRAALASRDAHPKIVIVNPDAVALGARLKQRFQMEGITRYFDLAQFVSATREEAVG